MMDRMPDDEDLPGAIREAVERNGDRITDLHVWQLGPGHHAAIIALASWSRDDRRTTRRCWPKSMGSRMLRSRWSRTEQIGICKRTLERRNRRSAPGQIASMLGSAFWAPSSESCRAGNGPAAVSSLSFPSRPIRPRRNKMGYSHYDAAVRGRAAWNAGKRVGTKRPLTQKQIWAIRFFLDREGRVRDRALF